MTAALSRGVKIPRNFDPFMPEPKLASRDAAASANQMRSAIKNWDKRVRKKKAS